MTDSEFEAFLQSALKRRPARSDKDAATRVLKRLAGLLPRQRTPLWRWPAVLLDWQFALAWPRLAARAGCLALGFAIGISGLDRRIDRIGANAGPADFGPLVFEPETLTGAQP
jgi:hypothetical protein